MAQPTSFEVTACAVVAENHAGRMFGCAGLYWPRYPEKKTQRATPGQLELLRAEAGSARRRIAISKIVALDEHGQPLGEPEVLESESASLSVQLDRAMAELARRAKVLDEAHDQIDALTRERDALARDRAGDTKPKASK